jgi:hypothetical protein
LPQPQNKKQPQPLALFYFYLFFIYFFYRIFGCFVTRGVQKHEKQILGWKKTSGLITHHKKCGFFFLRFFSFLPRLFCSIFFYRVFGRFVTRGVKKMRLKNRGNFSAAAKK